MKSIYLTLLLCLGAVITSSPASGEYLDRERLQMGTRFIVHLVGPDQSRLEQASRRVFVEVDRLESVLSNWDPESEISRLNASASHGSRTISPDLAEALDAAARLRDWTGGAFDPSVEPLMRSYDLRGTGHAPSADELLAALDSVGDRDDWWLDRSAGTATLTAGTAIDLGGIGKGIALDHAAEILREEGISDALLNFGGQILALGNDETGRGWEIALSSPTDRDRAIGRIRVRDASVSTTGQSERFVVVDGARVGHVLDPETGASARDWGSMTVVASSATVADGLSTGLFVMGPDRARPWIGEADGVAAFFLGNDGGVTVAGHSEHVLSIDGLMTAAADTDRVAGGAAPDVDLAAAFPPDPTDNPSNGSPAPSNEELARRIEIMAQELETMKLGDVAEGGGSVHGLGPGASKVYHVPRGVSLGGYGEALYENFAEDREDDEPSGRLDRLDYVRSVVYVGYKYNDRIVFNSELEFEHASTELAGSVSVEFANLDFRIDPRASVRAGLVLVPVGLTNELHEPPVYLGARRAETEQRVIPSTWRANGAGVYGEFAQGLSYRAYVLEGLLGSKFNAASGIRGGRQKGSQANADDLALAARVDYEGLPGLLVGASVFAGNSGAGATDSLGAEIDAATTVFDVHAQYQGHGIRARALYAQVSIDEADRLNSLPETPLTGNHSIGERLVGSYLEVGYDVMPYLRRGTSQALLPYVRLEQLNTQDEVPAGFAANPTNDEQGITFGVAYYPHSQVVLKADLHKRTNEAETGVDQWNLAAGYLF